MQLCTLARRRALGGPLVKIHPLTGEPIEPLAIIGGRPVWPILGGAETDDAGDDEPADTDEPEGEPESDDDDTDEPAEGEDTGAADEGEQSGTQPAKSKGKSAAQKASEEAKRRRLAQRAAEKAAADAKAERDRVFDALRKIVDPDAAQDADPADLVRTAASERDAARAEAKAARIEAAVGRAARAAGVDEDALLDSRAFQAAVSKLDPSSDEFRDEIAEAVKEAAEKRPSLRITPQGKGGSSGSRPAHGGGEPPKRKNDVDGIRADIRKRRGLG